MLLMIFFIQCIHIKVLYAWARGGKPIITLTTKELILLHESTIITVLLRLFLHIIIKLY